MHHTCWNTQTLHNLSRKFSAVSFASYKTLSLAGSSHAHQVCANKTVIWKHCQATYLTGFSGYLGHFGTRYMSNVGLFCTGSPLIRCTNANYPRSSSEMRWALSMTWRNLLSMGHSWSVHLARSTKNMAMMIVRMVPEVRRTLVNVTHLTVGSHCTSHAHEKILKRNVNYYCIRYIYKRMVLSCCISFNSDHMCELALP